MSELLVRRLLIDLDRPIGRHWNGGDAFRSAFFNALSMSFPAGEQLFIDSVRQGLKALPAEAQAARADEVRGFIGQEASHRRIHQLFNGHLASQGLVNHWEPRIQRRLKRLEGRDVRAWLAVTAATEHFTAILADHMLRHDAPLAGAEERLRTMWLWHASEESEHRCTAFDLYRAAGGGERWRRRLFLLVSWHFCTDVLRQTVDNLATDGTLWRRSTWTSGARLLFGRHGLVTSLFGPWRRYLSADFHPGQQDGRPAEDWLREHASSAVPIQAG